MIVISGYRINPVLSLGRVEFSGPIHELIDELIRLRLALSWTSESKISLAELDRVTEKLKAEERQGAYR